MGKITPVSIKYIVHADIKLTSIAEKPDVIGAIFGQTEGLLGSELELRELQKSGKIGRIEVNLESKKGRTSGEILLPSSLAKSETAIVAASLETIEKVGPCDSKIFVTKIEDVRVSKRNKILIRAKELLRNLVETLPDSQEFTNIVTRQVRALEIKEYGKDRLPAGPAIDDSEEIIVVEGRADVITMLKHGIRNVIALNGARATDTILELIPRKITTLFVDGDRGGDLIIKNLSNLSELDFVCKAPDGKEVEELTMKEIQKALRSKITWDQIAAEAVEKGRDSRSDRGDRNSDRSSRSDKRYEPRRERRDTPARKVELSKKNAKILKDMAEELIGTRGAFILDEALSILGKVPNKELTDTLENISESIYAIVVDGTADSKLVRVAENKNIQLIVAKDSSAGRSRIKIVSPKDL